jgi:hypothetical protein
LRFGEARDGRDVHRYSEAENVPSVAWLQEFPQNPGVVVANPFEFSVLLFFESGIARCGSIGPETSLKY